MKAAAVAFLAGFLPVAVFLNLAAAQTPSLAGTWNMSVAKSHYSPRAVPKRESVTYESSKDGFTYKVTATEADGTARRT
jgi:hypothetical protein